MTRKDYILLAAALKSAKPNPKWDDPKTFSQHETDCILIADALQSDNPRFNRERFLNACGLGEED